MKAISAAVNARSWNEIVLISKVFPVVAMINTSEKRDFVPMTSRKTSYIRSMSTTVSRKSS